VQGCLVHRSSSREGRIGRTILLLADKPRLDDVFVRLSSVLSVRAEENDKKAGFCRCCKPVFAFPARRVPTGRARGAAFERARTDTFLADVSSCSGIGLHFASHVPMSNSRRASSAVVPVTKVGVVSIGSKSARRVAGVSESGATGSRGKKQDRNAQPMHPLTRRRLPGTTRHAPPEHSSKIPRRARAAIEASRGGP
jgi:hypothetical protein